MRKFFALLFALALGIAPVSATGSFTLLGVGSAGAVLPPSLTFCSSAANSVSGTTMTFTSQAVCAANATRFLVIGATSCGTLVNSVTVNGTSATLLTSLSGFPNFWGFALPAGTTANIVVTKAVTSLCGSIGVWGINNLASQTPVSFIETGCGASLTCPLVIPTTIPGGFAIGQCATISGTLRTYTWSGATKEYDFGYGVGTNSTTGADTPTPGTSITITPTISAAGTNFNCVGLAMR